VGLQRGHGQRLGRKTVGDRGQGEKSERQPAPPAHRKVLCVEPEI
jgi:hypothetical protein